MLEEHLASPKLESFTQRVVARCYLEALNRAETQDYIMPQIAAAGGEGPQIFPAEACQSVYKATDGVPRLINQVCDHALLLAYAAGQRQLDAARIEEAWADLQQLPTPLERTDASPDRNIIEFGGLDDEPAEAAQASDPDQPAAEPEALPEAASLHIMPESEDGDDAEVGELEPADQLRHIQDMLADVEHDFCPAGSIGPEVELVFDEAAHPFQEPFQQEEVIKDRYAPPSAATAAEPDADAPPRRRLVQADSGRLTPRPKRPRRLLQTSRPPPSWPTAGRDTAGDQEAGVETEDTEAIDQPADEDAASEPAAPIAAVRRHEFGRLFVKLRQG